jgi:hypothetical protein
MALAQQLLFSQALSWVAAIVPIDSEAAEAAGYNDSESLEVGGIGYEATTEKVGPIGFVIEEVLVDPTGYAVELVIADPIGFAEDSTVANPIDFAVVLAQVGPTSSAVGMVLVHPISVVADPMNFVGDEDSSIGLELALEADFGKDPVLEALEVYPIVIVHVAKEGLLCYPLEGDLDAIHVSCLSIIVEVVCFLDHPFLDLVIFRGNPFLDLVIFRGNPFLDPDLVYVDLFLVELL